MMMHDDDENGLFKSHRRESSKRNIEEGRPIEHFENSKSNALARFKMNQIKRLNGPWIWVRTCCRWKVIE